MTTDTDPSGAALLEELTTEEGLGALQLELRERAAEQGVEITDPGLDDFLDYMSSYRRDDIETVESPILPIVRRSTFIDVVEENRRLERRLKGIEEMIPYLELARNARAAVLNLLDAHMDHEEVGALAFRFVLAREMESARGSLVAEYERQHREALMEQVFAHVEKTEGEELREQTRNKILSDPELRKELTESAQREIMAREEVAISAELSEAQEEIVKEEAQRRLSLDMFDVAFVRDGELDLSQTALLELLRAGDTLNLYFTRDGSSVQTHRLKLRWTKDATGSHGWAIDSEEVLSGGWESKIRADIPSKRFIALGTDGADMASGDTVLKHHLLTHRQQVAFTWHTNRGNVTNKTSRANEAIGTSIWGERRNLVLDGVDLETRELDFNLSSNTH